MTLANSLMHLHFAPERISIKIYLMRFFGTQIAGKKFRHGAAQECLKACELQVFLFDDIE